MLRVPTYDPYSISKFKQGPYEQASGLGGSQAPTQHFHPAGQFPTIADNRRPGWPSRQWSVFEHPQFKETRLPSPTTSLLALDLWLYQPRNNIHWHRFTFKDCAPASHCAPTIFAKIDCLFAIVILLIPAHKLFAASCYHIHSNLQHKTQRAPACPAFFRHCLHLQYYTQCFGPQQPRRQNE